MSDKSIGNAFVKKLVEKLLEPNGFKCQTAGSSIVWIPIYAFDPKKGKKAPVFEGGRPKLRPINRKEDFFGCIDILAINPNFPPYTFFIQATVGDRKRVWERKKKIEAVGKWSLPHQAVQIIQRDDDNKQRLNVYHLIPELDGESGYGWSQTTFDFKRPELVAILNPFDPGELFANQEN